MVFLKLEKAWCFGKWHLIYSSSYNHDHFIIFITVFHYFHDFQEPVGPGPCPSLQIQPFGLSPCSLGRSYTCLQSVLKHPTLASASGTLLWPFPLRMSFHRSHPPGCVLRCLQGSAQRELFR